MAEVDRAKLENAATLVDSAAAHFKARTAELYDIATEIRGGSRLGGGYGETGAYQQGLLNFCWKFEKVLDEFLTDETAFWMFLEGFSDRIRQSAGTYRRSELVNTESVNRIAEQLDSGGG